MAVKPFAVKGFNITSPKGKALWCKFKEPDTKYNDKGDLTTSLVCNPEDPAVKEYIGKLEELRDIALAETKETLGAKGAQYKARPVYIDEFDADGNPTGNIIFKYKLGNVADRTAQGYSDSIDVFDAKRNQIKDAPNVGNGSVIRCAAYANPYNNAVAKEVGVSLIWSKMQLIELVEYAGGSNNDFDDEDGFTDTAKAGSGDFDDVEDDIDF